MKNKIRNISNDVARQEFALDEKVAHVDVMWGKQTFVVDVKIVDLEAMRRGLSKPGAPLRDPQTMFEAETLIKHIRWLANFLSREWGLEHLVRDEDWNGDERPYPTDGEES